MARELTPEERHTVEFLLTKHFPGRDQLQEQLAHARVEGYSCECGCESVSFVVDRKQAPAVSAERVPTDAFGRDSEGRIVGVLLHVVDGYVDELEFYSPSGDTRFGPPTLDSLELAEWSDRDSSGGRMVLSPGTPHEPS